MSSGTAKERFGLRPTGSGRARKSYLVGVGRTRRSRGAPSLTRWIQTQRQRLQPAIRCRVPASTLARVGMYGGIPAGKLTVVTARLLTPYQTVWHMVPMVCKTEGARRLREYMRSKGLSIAEFAPRVPVSGASVSRWLSGHRTPNREKSLLIERVTGRRVPAEAWSRTVA